MTVKKLFGIMMTTVFVFTFVVTVFVLILLREDLPETRRCKHKPVPQGDGTTQCDQREYRTCHGNACGPWIPLDGRGEKP